MEELALSKHCPGLKYIRVEIVWDTNSYSDYVVALSCQIVAPWHWFCYAKLGVKCDLTADRFQSLGKGQVSTITDHQRGEIKFTYIKSIL